MFVHIGYEHYLDADHIECFMPPGSSATKRRVKLARLSSVFHDCTQGKTWKSVIVLKSGKVYISHLTSGTIVKRVNTGHSGKDSYDPMPNDLLIPSIFDPQGGGAGGGRQIEDMEKADIQDESNTRESVEDQLRRLSNAGAKVSE